LGLVLVNGCGQKREAASENSSEVIHRNACINNLRQIDGAKEQWALEHNKKKGAAVTEADIAEYIKGNRLPVCPQGGHYTLGKTGEIPTCSIPGHSLD
jgi:hypothetical protein